VNVVRFAFIYKRKHLGDSCRRVKHVSMDYVSCRENYLSSLLIEDLGMLNGFTIQ
jgi:hypothetical protein